MRNVVLVMDTTLNGKVDDVFAWFDGVPDDLYTEIDRGFGHLRHGPRALARDRDLHPRMDTGCTNDRQRARARWCTHD